MPYRIFFSQDEYICQIMKNILIAFYLTKEDCETLQSLSQVAVNYYKSKRFDTLSVIICLPNISYICGKHFENFNFY